MKVHKHGKSSFSKEKESKFLVLGDDLDLRGLPKENIEQAYVSVDPNGVEVRVRRSGASFFLTVKSGGDIARDEYEAEIGRASFSELRKMSLRRVVTKTRYYLSQNKLWSLDVYSGSLKGLTVLEIEGKQVASPSKVLKELLKRSIDVTYDEFFKNKNLSTSDIKRVKQHLAERYNVTLNKA